MVDAQFILQCIYVMMPAYFGNMAPVFFRNWFSWMAIPLDGGKSWKGKRIFGNHKTVRGLVMGIVLGIVTAGVQNLLQDIPYFASLSIMDYSSWIVLGALMGCGAIFGDAAKSFVKRRAGIPDGDPFIPFDQLDFAVGALIMSSMVVVLSLEAYLTIILLSVALHILTNHAAFFLKIRKERW